MIQVFHVTAATCPLQGQEREPPQVDQMMPCFLSAVTADELQFEQSHLKPSRHGYPKFVFTCTIYMLSEAWRSLSELREQARFPLSDWVSVAITLNADAITMGVRNQKGWCSSDEQLHHRACGFCIYQESIWLLHESTFQCHRQLVLVPFPASDSFLTFSVSPRDCGGGTPMSISCISSSFQLMWVSDSGVGQFITAYLK